MKPTDGTSRKIITVGSRGQAGPMTSQIWGEEIPQGGSEDMASWSPEPQVRSWLDTGRRAEVFRPEFLWGNRLDVDRDISRELRKAHGTF